MRGPVSECAEGELEAARAYGMSPFTVVRRIWLPRAVRVVLPTLGGDVILQPKLMLIAALVTVNELYGAAGQVYRTTFDFFPPMLLVAVV